jgi:Cu+-exporting ATPase
VNLATGQGRVVLQPGCAPQAAGAALKDALEHAGYGFSDLLLPGHHTTRASKTPTDPSSSRQELFIVVVGLILTLPLVAPMILAPLGVHAHPSPWCQFVLATPVQFVLGARFYKGAWHALRTRVGTMDLLVATGTSAAWGLSTWLLVQHELLGSSSTFASSEPALYFESSAVVIALVLLGKHLEARAKHSTLAALEGLKKLMPHEARRVLSGPESDREEMVPCDDLRPSDRVAVLPGERIPVDGVVETGAAFVDESMVTGESRPVSRSAGDKLLAGTLCLDGRLVLKATSVGAQSTVARMVELVESAQLAKAPIQRLVDRISSVFVPIVFAIAIATLVGWLVAGAGVEKAILSSVAVLVIACPCALGIATPAAILVGTGLGARLGLLIKDAEALEKAHNIGAVVFDKTGTLTEGRLELVRLVRANDHLSDAPDGDNLVLQTAAALQATSVHPMAKAVLDATLQNGQSWQPAQMARALPGLGVEGQVNGHSFVLGSAGLMAQLGAGVAETGLLQKIEQTGPSAAWSWCFLAERIEGLASARLVAAFGFEDKARGSSQRAVSALQNLGIRVHVLSGDGHAATAALAARLGVSSFDAEVLPEGKVAVVRRLQHEIKSIGKGRGSRLVAMVGDGINDAPALAAADVSFALAGGTEVARHAAHVTLMRNDPWLVVQTIALSRKTYRKIQQNLFWAFVFNALGIPLAAAGWLSPVLAGTAMALSSVTVITNALLLRGWLASARRMG